MAWSPDQYERFRDERGRPARDLVAALPHMEPRRIVDLGCGTGALARQLADRWPDAETWGVDASPEMLAKARALPSPVHWVQQDLARWRPPQAADLIMSNAALHWLPDHAGLFSGLLDAIVPGGVLAVQMPRNFAAPSHRAVAEIARDPRWSDRLGGTGGTPVHEPARYVDWLAPRTRRLDVWETEYFHVLEGDSPVLEWLKGTTLVPILARLDAEEAERFLGLLGSRLDEAYPKRSDGRTLFPFRRLFIVATVR